MKRLFLLFLFFASSLALAQGVFVPPQIALKTLNGVTYPIANATITVCAANTPGIPCSPALTNTIFKDLALTQPLANPFTADAQGNYNFAITGGTYTATVTAAGFAGYSYQLSAPTVGTAFSNLGNVPGPTQTFTVTAPFHLFVLTLTGNVSTSTCVLTGISVPSWVTFEWTQDGTGGRSFAPCSQMVGLASIGTSAGQLTKQTFLWDGSNLIGDPGVLNP